MRYGRRALPADLRERAVDHVERLARRLGATVVFSSRDIYNAVQLNAVVDHDTRRVVGPAITSAVEYFVLLHELGHLASRSKSTDEIVDEGAAWAWAAKRADPEIMARMTRASWALVGDAFTSYVAHYAGRVA